MNEYQIIDMILRLDLKTTTKLVFVALARKLDWNTWSKPMSVSYIHNALGQSVSQRGISRALSDLQRLGVITRVESERPDNTKVIILNISVLKSLCQDLDTMSDPDTMSEVTLRHGDPDTMSEVGMTPCHGDPDTMSDNILYNTLNNTLNNTLSESPELEQSAEDEKTNESIRLYFKTSKAEEVEPKKPLMNNDEIKAYNKNRQERIWQAQEYKANPTKRRRRTHWR